MSLDKRMIDADKLIEVVEYQCLNEPNEESTRWCEWFKQVINSEYSRERDVFNSVIKC